MPVTVGQLAALPDLATRVVAGRAGVDTEIGWAHVCEQPDPWAWIGAGDLLMTTGLGVPPGAPRQVDYVGHLAERGAAGVAIGEDMDAPPLTSEMLEAADRLGLPLMLTRRDIPFIALARAVAEANTVDHLARIHQTELVYEVLRRSSTDDLDLAELLSALADIGGCRLFLVDLESLRSHVPGEDVPEPLTEAVRRWSPGRHDEAPTLFHVPGSEAAGVVVPSPRPAALVATSASGAAPDPTLLRHMAAAAALHQTRQFAERERSLRLGASLLAQLVDQTMSATAARAALSDVGLAGTELLLAACGSGAGRQDLHLLHHRLLDESVAHIMLTRPPLTYVLLPSTPQASMALAEALPDGTSTGFSDPVTSPTDLLTALRQARWALHRAQERQIVAVHHSDDLGDSVFLPGDREDGRAAARRVLGPVLAYDEAHDAHLLQSLRVFLQENRSWQRAAERLHVHKQTLVYRIRRVEELTSRRLSDTGDVADLWLALQAATASGLIER